MTLPSTMQASPSMSLSAPALARTRISIAGLSLSGMLLFVTGVLVAGSGFMALRPEVFGLRVHPYILPVALAFPFVFLARFDVFPSKVLAALLVFVAIYIFSVFNGASVSVGEIFKVVSALVTIVTCALLVRRRGDFVIGALGLSIAVAMLAIHGLREDVAGGGVDMMEGANKNSYSLFALPAFLLAGYIVINLQSTPMYVKGMFAVCTLPALVVTFMGGNRSGYLGAVLIAVMLFWNRRGKGLIFVAVLGSAAAFWILQFGTTKVLNERLRQTVAGNESDESRIGLFLSCLAVGMENPIIGVSPQRLPWEIGRKMQIQSGLNVYDPHNVFGHIIGGSGVICLAALGAVAWTLCTLKPRSGPPLGGSDDPARAVRNLLRMYVALWAVRGMFSREVLYNPAFNIALGLCIGLFILAETARKDRPAPGLKPSL